MANKYVDVPWTPFKQVTDQTTVPSKCNSYKVCFKNFKSTPELVNGDSPNVVKKLIGTVVTKYDIFVGIADSKGSCNPTHRLWNDPASVNPPTCTLIDGKVSVWVGEPTTPTAAPTDTPVPPGGTGVPSTAPPTTSAPSQFWCPNGEDKGCPNPLPAGCSPANPWYSSQSKLCHPTQLKPYYLCCSTAKKPLPTTPAPTDKPKPTPTPPNVTMPPTKPNSTAPPVPSKTAAPTEEQAQSLQLTVLSQNTWNPTDFEQDLADALNMNESSALERFKITGTKQTPSKLKGYKQQVTIVLTVKPTKDEKLSSSTVRNQISKLAQKHKVLGNATFELAGTAPSPSSPTATPTSSSASAVPGFIGMCAALVALSHQ